MAGQHLDVDARTSVDAGRCPVDHGGDHHGYRPFDMKDPFPAYAELRHEHPVMYDERIGYWVVTRWADVRAVFEDWETFSSENAQAPVRPRGAEATRIMKEGDMLFIPKGIAHRSMLAPESAPENVLIELKISDDLTYVGDNS